MGIPRKITYEAQADLHRRRVQLHITEITEL